MSPKPATRRIFWRKQLEIAGPGQPGAPHTNLLSSSRVTAIGQPAQTQFAIGTGIESAVDIWLTRVGGAAPDVLSPAASASQSLARRCVSM
ncbi:hypothetical protein BVI1335_1030021 [Burkholderia vietnamiensis]|nr:hypothetical protein BVI1335_1030021 [Burkholderia vietnamiensis]